MIYSIYDNLLLNCLAFLNLRHFNILLLMTILFDKTSFRFTVLALSRKFAYHGILHVVPEMLQCRCFY